MASVKGMISVAHGVGLHTVAEAYSNYLRHYDLFFKLDDTLDVQFDKFNVELFNLGWLEVEDGKGKIVELPIAEAMKQLGMEAEEA